MRSSIITCIALTFVFGTIAVAQEQERQRDTASGRPEAVDQALKERYGEDTRVEIVGTPSEINGVKVFRVNIRDERGTSNALVTEYGDFLMSGMPREFDKLPDEVRQTTGLFKSEPQSAQGYIADGYYIDVTRDGDDGEQVYRLRYDPLGRLREINSPEEVERYQPSQFKEADDKSVAGKVQELAEQHVPRGSKVEGVFVDPRYEGFYVVQYQSPRDREILVILDENGNIYQTRTEVEPSEFPNPVRQSFDRMFDARNVKSAYRTQYEFYEFEQQSPQGPVTFRVRPTGAIMSVDMPEADQADEAVTAKFREEAGREKTGPQQRPGGVIGRDRDREDRD